MLTRVNILRRQHGWHLAGAVRLADLGNLQSPAVVLSGSTMLARNSSSSEDIPDLDVLELRLDDQQQRAPLRQAWS